MKGTTMIFATVLYNLKLFIYIASFLQKFESLYNLENHDNCIQFQQNYGECPPDYDQYFISQKLKYQVKTPSRHNIASIASFKR